MTVPKKYVKDEFGRQKTQRQCKVEELIREVLADYFIRECLPNVRISVTYVDVSKDLKYAKVYVIVVMTDSLSKTEVESQKAYIKLLNQNKNEVRAGITPKLGLKYSPEVVFYADKSWEML